MKCICLNLFALILLSFVVILLSKQTLNHLLYQARQHSSKWAAAVAISSSTAAQQQLSLSAAARQQLCTTAAARPMRGVRACTNTRAAPDDGKWRFLANMFIKLLERVFLLICQKFGMASDLANCWRCS
jgi:hypothetical protein